MCAAALPPTPPGGSPTPNASASVAAPPSSQPTESGEAHHATAKPKLRIEFPPVKDKSEVLQTPRAAVSQEDIRDDMENDIPPVIRSVLELSHLTMSGHSQWLRASPGYQGGLFHKGKPFCFASGYRDTSRPLDAEDKGNHMRLKDPLVYGTLSLPVTAAYLCELHGKEIFDLEKPLVAYLPELQGKMGEEVTARSILSFTHGFDDMHLLKDAAAQRWRLFFSPFLCAETYTRVYQPVERFLAGGAASPSSLTGQQQRANLVQYVRSARRIRHNFIRSPRRARISHTSVALLLAAVETQLKGSSFESHIRTGFFERAQSYGSGYGVPSLWKDPNELFYQPTGQALQHERFKHHIPVGDPRNCGPAVWNGSLNLYAPPEDYGKLLLLSLDTIMDARELLGKSITTSSGAYYDFGVLYIPSKDQLQLTKSVFHGIDALPAGASFRYSCQHDLGCFGIASCGTRSARFFVNNLSRMIQHLFVKHVLAKGLDPEKPVNLSDPMGNGEGSEDRLGRVIKQQKFTSYFTKTDVHKRY